MVRPSPQPKQAQRANISNLGIKSCISCLTILGMFVLLLVAYSVMRYFMDRSAYTRAHAARVEARCEEAIPAYSGLINSFRLLDFGDFEVRAKAELEECELFADFDRAQADGLLHVALFGYQSFIQSYPDSPLVQPARARMAEMITGEEPSTMASDSFCSSMESLATTAKVPTGSPAWPAMLNACGDFYQQGGDQAGAYALYTRVLNEYPGAPEAERAGQSLQNSLYACGRPEEVMGIPALASNSEYLPAFLYNCGMLFEGSSSFGDAARAYQSFLDRFPGHALAETVKEAYARAAIANARNLGAGEIPTPSQVGGEAGASTVVVIQNDSPNTLRIVLSGPETRIEEIAPCPDCITYIGDGPEFCPEQGPMGTYELPSGTYQVMVESSTADDVTPFTGTWDLTGGEYYSCFLIIRTTD